jgi:hypothetical protein
MAVRPDDAWDVSDVEEPNFREFKKKNGLKYGK